MVYLITVISSIVLLLLFAMMMVMKLMNRSPYFNHNQLTPLAHVCGLSAIEPKRNNMVMVVADGAYLDEHV